MEHSAQMALRAGPVAIHRTVLETLTVDAMVLADEVESAVTDAEGTLREGVTDSDAVLLRIARQLALAIRWLIDLQSEGKLAAPLPAWTEPATEEALGAAPARVRALTEAARVVFERAARLSEVDRTGPVVSPARQLQARLASMVERPARD